MYEEMIRLLTSFANRNKLRFNYCFDEDARIYRFIFSHEERVWRYTFEEFEERLEIESSGSSS